MPDRNQRSISKRLIWMNLFVSATALLLACSAFIGYDLITFRQNKIHALSARAEIIAATTTSALLFNDSQSAKDVLTSLKGTPDTLAAAVYAKDGKLFASYSRGQQNVNASALPMPQGQSENYWIQGREIVFQRSIELDGRQVGVVSIWSSSEELQQRLALYGGIGGVVLLLSLLAALAVSYFFQRSVSMPIIQLAETAKNITRSRNYSSRVPPVRDRGELSALIESFNEMVAQIQLHEEEIRKGKDELELRVQERTAELVRAKEEVERTSKFKDQFLSTMSHELRTPLNAVIGFSEMLSAGHHGALNEKQKRYVDHIQKGGHHLLRLINDILDISKIEAGRLQLSIESISIDAVFSEIGDALQPLAEKKFQKLAVEATPSLSVLADPIRFKQILMNLLGNAIKFTPSEGKIELRAKVQGGFARVEVRDTGPGIPREEQQRIFEAFHRIRQTSGAIEGTGLGLAITRSLVELHGGELGLESEPGLGSCFFLTLPLAKQVSHAGPRKDEAEVAAGNNATVLIIEDDPSAIQLLESQLISAGYKTVVCDRPQDAVDRAAELKPDAITLDIVMKPFSGWDILSALKSDPRTAKIPVIVVTITDQQDMGTLLGADEYIAKPVDRTVLLQAIQRCLSGRGIVKNNETILVVEDDAPTREFIAETLSRNGYQVITAADGLEACARVEAALPDLVILDLILPQMGGLQLLSEWRCNARTANLPVLVLTSKDLSVEERRYLRENVDALFSKQDRWQEALVKRIEQVMSSEGVAQ